MISAHLALIVILGQTPQPNPTALVAQLGASRYADRESAAGALECLGRQALPALRAAHASKDPEIRARASALLQKIEGALLTQPTLVKLDFENRPVSEVVREISAQTGIKLALFPENLPIWQSVRVTLRDPTPVSFWKAIDRLCDEGHLYYTSAMPGMPAARVPAFQLFYGGGRPAGPVSDQGPFRVSLQGLHYQRDVSFLQGSARGAPFAPGMMPPPPMPARPFGQRQPVQRLLGLEGQPGMPGNPNPSNHTVTNQFYAQLQIVAEPRLSLGLNGPLKNLEAVDDQGQSLVLPPVTGAMLQRTSGYFGLNAGSVVPLQVPLSYPAKPGKTIHILRGIVPLVVTTRKPNPLTIPLTGASGKTFQNDDVSLCVQEIKVNPGTHQTSIELSVRSNEPRVNSLAVAGAPGAEFIYHRPDMHQQQIEVVDSKGRPIAWYHSSYDAEGSRMTLTLTPQDQTATPTQLRYFGLARAVTEVRFEFSDLPME